MSEETIIRLEERLIAQQEREHELVERVKTLEAEYSELRRQIAKGHGIFLAVVGIGTFIGWLLTQASSVVGLRR